VAKTVNGIESDRNHRIGIGGVWKVIKKVSHIIHRNTGIIYC